MAEITGVGFCDDATGTCRPIPEVSGGASVSDEQPPKQDLSSFLLDDHARLRYVPQGAVWRFNFFDLFAGCGGKLDLCIPLQKGSCSDTSGAVPISVDEAPPFSYDLAARTRSALELFSTANPCLLDGLNGAQYLKMADKGDYLVERRQIQIDPTQMSSTVTNVEQHWFLMRARLYHELGHHIFHYVMPSECDSMTPQFTGISWQESGAMLPGMNPDVTSGDFLNGDAVKNADEDFAVCMAYYFVQPDEFRTRAKSSPTLARKYDFIKSLLRGNEF